MFSLLSISLVSTSLLISSFIKYFIKYRWVLQNFPNCCNNLQQYNYLIYYYISFIEFSQSAFLNIRLLLSDLHVIREKLYMEAWKSSLYKLNCWLLDRSDIQSRINCMINCNHNNIFLLIIKSMITITVMPLYKWYFLHYKG